MADPDDPCAVYVGGLSFNTDDDKLRKEFADMGEIASTKVIYDRVTRQTRGFGFVVFASPRAAQVAIRKMDGQVVDGRQICVREVRKKEDRSYGREVPRGGASFRDRDRDRDRDRGHDRHGRRSPVPGRGRARSPVNPRRSFSPRRSPRPSSPPPGRRRTRTPSSPIESPRRKGGEPELEQDQDENLPNVELRSEKAPSDEREPELERPANNLEDLQSEVDHLTAKRNELAEKVKFLEATLDRSSSAEASLEGKIQRLEQSLKEATGAHQLRSSAIVKIYRAVSRIQNADEQRKESEKELKVLLSAVATEMEGADDG